MSSIKIIDTDAANNISIYPIADKLEERLAKHEEWINEAINFNKSNLDNNRKILELISYLDNDLNELEHWNNLLSLAIGVNLILTVILIVANTFSII